MVWACAKLGGWKSG